MIKDMLGFTLGAYLFMQVIYGLISIAVFNDHWEKNCNTPAKNYAEILVKNALAPVTHVTCFLAKPFDKED